MGPPVSGSPPPPPGLYFNVVQRWVSWRRLLCLCLGCSWGAGEKDGSETLLQPGPGTWPQNSETFGKARESCGHIFLFTIHTTHERRNRCSFRGIPGPLSFIIPLHPMVWPPFTSRINSESLSQCSNLPRHGPTSPSPHVPPHVCTRHRGFGDSLKVPGTSRPQACVPPVLLLPASPSLSAKSQFTPQGSFALMLLECGLPQPFR